MSKFVILANRCFAGSRLIDTKLTYFYKINKRLKSSFGNIAVKKTYKFDIQIIDIFFTAKKYSSFSRHFPCGPRSPDGVSPSCGTLRRAVAAGAGAGPAVREHPDAPALRRRLYILVRGGRIFRSVTEEETARRRRIGFRQEPLAPPPEPAGRSAADRFTPDREPHANARLNPLRRPETTLTNRRCVQKRQVADRIGPQTEPATKPAGAAQHADYRTNITKGQFHKKFNFIPNRKMYLFNCEF